MDEQQAQNPQQTPSMTPPVNPIKKPENPKSVGPAIGIVIIILVIILGALYFWGQTIDRREAMINQQMSEMEQQSEENLPAQSSSDDLSSIEADLNMADFDSLGNEFDSVEAGASAQ